MSFIFTLLCVFLSKTRRKEVLINYDSIKTTSDAAQIINDNLKARISYIEEITNTPVVSKATKKVRHNHQHFQEIAVP